MRTTKRTGVKVHFDSGFATATCNISYGKYTHHTTKDLEKVTCRKCLYRLELTGQIPYTGLYRKSRES